MGVIIWSTDAYLRKYMMHGRELVRLRNPIYRSAEFYTPFGGGWVGKIRSYVR